MSMRNEPPFIYACQTYAILITGSHWPVELTLIRVIGYVENGSIFCVGLHVQYQMLSIDGENNLGEWGIFWGFFNGLLKLDQRNLSQGKMKEYNFFHHFALSMGKYKVAPQQVGRVSLIEISSSALVEHSNSFPLWSGLREVGGGVMAGHLWFIFILFRFRQIFVATWTVILKNHHLHFLHLYSPLSPPKGPIDGWRGDNSKAEVPTSPI